MKWYVYVLKCRDGSYYVGHTSDLRKRFRCHKSGTGARHTAHHEPDEIIYTETFENPEAAVARERQLKRWSRAKKESLVRGDFQRLHELSRSHD
jgi:predicted GIY-YIG superfamily endonuclease